MTTAAKLKKPFTGTTWDRQVDDEGEYVRRPTSFRSAIATDGSTAFVPEADRYHLYVSLACPWAHRTLIVRRMKGLEDAISVDVVDPLLPPTGWTFDQNVPGATGDRVNDRETLREVYLQARPDYEGVVTVPVLWDKQTGAIVNNESSEIIRMLNAEFQDIAAHPEVDLYPLPLRAEIDELNEWIYRDINNGVYRSGFARKQRAYSRAVQGLFAGLDRVEAIRRRAPVHHPGPLRQRLRDPLQVQPAPHRRLPQSLGLYPRDLPDAGCRRDRRHGTYQAPLLRVPPSYQSFRDRPGRPGTRLRAASRTWLDRGVRTHAVLSGYGRT
jgi:hypothetical protein